MARKLPRSINIGLALVCAAGSVAKTKDAMRELEDKREKDEPTDTAVLKTVSAGAEVGLWLAAAVFYAVKKS